MVLNFYRFGVFMRLYMPLFIVLLTACDSPNGVQSNLLAPAELCKKMNKLNPERLSERKISICTKKMADMKTNSPNAFTTVQSCLSKAKTKEDTTKCPG